MKLWLKFEHNYTTTEYQRRTAFLNATTGFRILIDLTLMVEAEDNHRFIRVKAGHYEIDYRLNKEFNCDACELIHEKFVSYFDHAFGVEKEDSGLFDIYALLKEAEDYALDPEAQKLSEDVGKAIGGAVC